MKTNKSYIELREQKLVPYESIAFKLNLMLSLHLATISPISQRLKNRGALRLNGILHVLLRFLTKSARFVALYCALLRSSPRFASRSVTLCCDQHDWLPRSTTFRYVLLRSPTTKPLCYEGHALSRLENESGQSW